MQRKWTITLVAMLLLTVALSSCSGGPQPMAPEGCMPEVSQETALAAQEKAMAGMLTGSVELTSSELSSLASGLIQANAPNLSLEELTYCIAPDASYVKIVTTDGAILEGVGDTLIVDNRFVVNLQALSLNGQALPEATLDIMVGTVNRALDDPSLAVAGSLEYGDDVVTVSLGP